MKPEFFWKLLTDLFLKVWFAFTTDRRLQNIWLAASPAAAVSDVTKLIPENIWQPRKKRLDTQRKQDHFTLHMIFPRKSKHKAHKATRRQNLSFGCMHKKCTGSILFQASSSQRLHIIHNCAPMSFNLINCMMVWWSQVYTIIDGLIVKLFNLPSCT